MAEHVLVREAQVVTSDGEAIGFVGEIRETAFQVDVDETPHAWLPMSCVAWADAVAVRLECTIHEVGEHYVPAPEETSASQ